MEKIKNWVFEIIVWVIICIVISWIVLKCGGSEWLQGALSTIVAVRVNDMIS